MAVSLKGRNILTLRDLTREEIWQLVKTAEILKMEKLRGQKNSVLEGKSVGLIFQKPSLRTRVAFEVGMFNLGGHAVYLGPDDIKLGKRETTEDIGTVLSRYVDGIMARVFSHEDVEELAESARVPVLNGLSEFTHPSQGLADLLTIYEKKGRLEGIKMAFVGDGNNMAHTLMFAATKMGMHINLAIPHVYNPREDAIEDSKRFARESGGSINIMEDPKEAVKDVDVIYTDVWMSMGEGSAAEQEKEKEERRKIFLPYQVNMDLLNLAREDAIVMHCLPAIYGEEITKDVVEDPRGRVVYDEAENRMHTAMAMMALTMGDQT